MPISNNRLYNDNSNESTAGSAAYKLHHIESTFCKEVAIISPIANGVFLNLKFTVALFILSASVE